MENQTQIEMPRYVCHKKVWALKIGAIEILEDQSANIVPKDSRFALIKESPEWTKRFKGSLNDDPGYYIVYSDGYKSWSPTKAFEEGYSLIQ